MRIKQNRTAKRPYRRVVAALLLAILIGMAGLTARAGKAQSCRFPLESSGWRVSDAYGWREDPFTGQKTFHRGIDLACGEGTPVLAVMDGVVSQARMSTSYGNVLRLCHEMDRKPSTRICNTSLSAPARSWVPARSSEPSARPDEPPARTSTLNSGRMEMPVTRRKFWMRNSCHKATGEFYRANLI